jgi:hypothetical protein
MVIPLTVLTASHTLPAGWTDAPVDVPEWWEPPLAEPPEGEPPAPIKPIKKKGKGLLFPIDEEEEDKTPKVEAGPAAQKPPAAWIAALLASPIIEDQKKLAGRVVPPNEAIANVLAALDQRGGKMTSTALSKALNVPPLRLRGILVVVQRILNIDGFAVLTRDDASDTAELNRELLIRQFDLPQG